MFLALALAALLVLAILTSLKSHSRLDRSGTFLANRKRLKGHHDKRDERSTYSAVPENALHERFADTIEGIISSVAGSHEPDLAARKCLIAVAKVAGQERYAPKTYDLDEWERSAPPEYSRLLGYLRVRIRDHILAKSSDDAASAASELKNRAEIHANILKVRHRQLVEKFLEIAYQKVSLRDEYGDPHWELLDPEIDIVLDKMIARESAENMLGQCDSIVEYLNRFRGLSNAVRDRLSSIDPEFVELDRYVFANLRSLEPSLYQRYCLYEFRFILRTLFRDYYAMHLRPSEGHKQR